MSILLFGEIINLIEHSELLLILYNLCDLINSTQKRKFTKIKN